MAERTVMQAALFYEFASIVASSAATLAARRRSTADCAASFRAERVNAPSGKWFVRAT